MASFARAGCGGLAVRRAQSWRHASSIFSTSADTTACLSMSDISDDLQV